MAIRPSAKKPKGAFSKKPKSPFVKKLATNLTKPSAVNLETKNPFNSPKTITGEDIPIDTVQTLYKQTEQYAEKGSQEQPKQLSLENIVEEPDEKQIPDNDTELDKPHSIIPEQLHSTAKQNEHLLLNNISDSENSPQFTEDSTSSGSDSNETVQELLSKIHDSTQKSSILLSKISTSTDLLVRLVSVIKARKHIEEPKHHKKPIPHHEEDHHPKQEKHKHELSSDGTLLNTLNKTIDDKIGGTLLNTLNKTIDDKIGAALSSIGVAGAAETLAVGVAGAITLKEGGEFLLDQVYGKDGVKVIEKLRQMDAIELGALSYKIKIKGKQGWQKISQLSTGEIRALLESGSLENTDYNKLYTILMGIENQKRRTPIDIDKMDKEVESQLNYRKDLEKTNLDIEEPSMKSPPSFAEAIKSTASNIFSGKSAEKQTNPQVKPSTNIKASSEGSAEREKAGMKILMEQGWAKEDAAAIMGNLRAESSLDPSAVGDKGLAVGVAQWHPDRQKKFKEIMGKDISESSYEDQVLFVDWELKNTHKSAGEKLKSAKTLEEKSQAIEGKYEITARSLKGEYESKRTKTAERLASMDLETPESAEQQKQNLAPTKENAERLTSMDLETPESAEQQKQNLAPTKENLAKLIAEEPTPLSQELNKPQTIRETPAETSGNKTENAQPIIVAPQQPVTQPIVGNTPSAGKIMSVRNDDPLILNLQYGMIRTT